MDGPLTVFMCHIDFVLVVVILNVSLSAIHALLERVYLKTQNKVDDRIYNITGYLLTVLEWVMAARRIKK